MKTFWARVLHALPVILTIALLTFAAGRLGWLDHFETTGLDTILLLRAPEPASHVLVLGIDDADYTSLFRERSPLDPNVLQKVIDAVARGGAAVIAVDLDTSSRDFRALRPGAFWPAVVWATDAPDAGRPPPAPLGGALPATLQGAAVFPQDSDGIIRRYARQIAGKNRYFDAFPYAVVRAYCALERSHCSVRAQPAGGSAETVILDFAAERYRYRNATSVSEVVSVGETPAWSRSRPFAGKIVLIGGLYRAARDTYVTPVGAMPGAYIVAQAIETELGNGGVRPLREAVGLMLDLIVGLIVVYLNFAFPLRTGLVLSVLGLPILSLVASYLAFSTFALWLNFAPMILGTLVHELYDQALEYRRLLKKMGRVDPDKI